MPPPCPAGRALQQRRSHAVHELSLIRDGQPLFAQMQSVVGDGEIPEVRDDAYDAQERLQRHVLAPFEADDIRSGDAGPLGDFLLCQTGLLPCFSDLKVQLHGD